jgi:Ca2+/H+ antiporter
MPLVTAIAVLFGDPSEQFKLIFPLLNVFSVMLAVFTLVFVSREGHTNYFIGMKERRKERDRDDHRYNEANS